MTTKQIEALKLSIGDLMQVTLIDFYYKLTQEEKRRALETSFKKKEGREWKQCLELTGTYCGDNYKQEPYEINIIKVRVTKPFKMGDSYRNYISIPPSSIKLIQVLQREEGNILDKVNHAVTKKKRMMPV